MDAILGSFIKLRKPGNDFTAQGFLATLAECSLA
jgi:hypothetical protein